MKRTFLTTTALFLLATAACSAGAWIDTPDGRRTMVPGEWFISGSTDLDGLKDDATRLWSGSTFEYCLAESLIAGLTTGVSATKSYSSTTWPKYITTEAYLAIRPANGFKLNLSAGLSLPNNFKIPETTPWTVGISWSYMHLKK